jgi:TolA-binding protein
MLMAFFPLLFGGVGTESLADSGTELQQAQGYFENSDYQQAEQIYQGIIKKCSDSDQALEAQKGLVMVYISWGKQADAEMAYQQLLLNFPHNTHMADVIHHGIASHYRKCKKNDKADEIDKYVLSHWPTTESAMWAQVDVINSNIDGKDYTTAQTGIDNLLARFSSNENMANVLHGMAYKYRQAQKTAMADELDKYVLNHWPSSEIALWARLDIIKSDANEQGLLNKLIADFSGHPRLPETLYWIARKYEDTGEFEEAKRNYQQIVQNFSDSPYTDRARFDIRGTDILILIKSGEVNEAEILTDKLIADFKNNPRLPEVLSQNGAIYYGQASHYEKEDREEQSKEYYKKAVAVWEKIATQLAPNAEYTPQACYSIAYCCFDDTGEYEKAIEYCQKIVNNWPEYEHACQAQFLLGNYYERLVQAGLIPESETNPIIEEAYKALIEKYPNCDKVKNVSMKLAEMNFKKEQWDKAAVYYEILLTTFPENKKPVSILYLLGQTYENMGKKDEAIKAYNEFLLKATLGDPRI